MAWDQVFYLTPSDTPFTKVADESVDTFDRTYSWEMPTANGSRNPEQYELENTAVEDLKLLPQSLKLKAGETKEDSSASTSGDIGMGVRSWNTQDPPSDD